MRGAPAAASRRAPPQRSAFSRYQCEIPASSLACHQRAAGSTTNPYEGTWKRRSSPARCIPLCADASTLLAPDSRDALPRLHATCVPLKRPDERTKPNGDYRDQDIERHANLYVIVKPVPARTIDHQVGLIADRRGEAGRGRHHHRDHERHGVHIQLVGGGKASGNISAAAALLVINSVTISVTR